MIPPRNRRGDYEDEDPCADCTEMDCRGWRWLLLPLIALVVFLIIYLLVPGDHKPHAHHPVGPPGGSLSGELSDDLNDK